MEKQFILNEIKRVADANGGKAPGQKRFGTLTGIQSHHWRGKHWTRWSEALTEAGLEENNFNQKRDRDAMLKEYVAFARELGHVPTHSELLLRRRKSGTFPHVNVLTETFGPREKLLSAAMDYAQTNNMDQTVLSLFATIKTQSRSEASTEDESVESNDFRAGFVYLMKSGRHYKIGKTNALDRRQYEIGLELPEKIEAIHSISTDDPSGIEAYWHNRFKAKRLNGEWFALSIEDVRAFKRRKFM